MSKTPVTITEDMLRDAATAYGEAMLASRAEDVKNNTKRSASRIINHRRAVLRFAVCILAVFVVIGGLLSMPLQESAL